ncbi:MULTISPECIES: hypothetical protein [Halomonadaceae]|uniref:Uncharacterized protein n=1 Tax=Vreelandella titanicae TaxID=664683 RepID=A0AAP9SZF3_9GAMM|nr:MULTISPECIES: hypothetical protein [Halomonas]QKS23547.1 hypothetical protein FX987_01306 [Halomonas titanicae]CDG55213.1 hypothetical protein HALA3H3_880030 [Halomonas sp. A3H3]SDI36393.1 hypothetical protein SAMN04487867_10584 [Halomonas titanicae]
MKNYIVQTEHATRALVDLIAADHKALSDANDALRGAMSLYDVQYQVFSANEFHTAANHYHAQMARAHQAKADVDAGVKSISASIDAKSASIAALSGALLQVAKQGLSVVYGKPPNTPKGAEISGLLVKDIIWEGRNQSIHYENPKEISDAVVELFGRIDGARNDGVSWDPRSRYNFAFDIINFLGWLDWKQFKDHMLSIQRR